MIRNKLILLMIGMLLSACTSVIEYKPKKNMSVETSIKVIEKLTISQHPTWRPDFININNEYISWGFGSVIKSSANSIQVQNTTIAQGSSTVRNASERLYFEDIKKVELLSWKRKFKQWYVVSAITKHKERKNLLRTRYKDEAQNYIDAIYVFTQMRK